MERKEYKRYSREFKLEAVRLASLGEKPKAQVARELGIRVNQLRNWRLEFEEEEHVGAPKRATVQEDDVAKLDPASFPRTAAHAAINAAS